MRKFLAAIAALSCLAGAASAQVYDGSVYKYGGNTYTWTVTGPDQQGNCNARCDDTAGYTTGWLIGTAGAPSAQGTPSVMDTNPAQMVNVQTGEGDPNGRRDVDVSGGKCYGSTNGGVFISMRAAQKEQSRKKVTPGGAGSTVPILPRLLGPGDDVETTPGS